LGIEVRDDTIYLSGDIDEESYSAFDIALSEIEESAEIDNVILKIISFGGDAYSALAFFDRIKRSPLNVRTHGDGMVASAATLILAAGSTRSMAKNAWLMVHEDTAGATQNMKVSPVERVAAHARRVENQWAGILADVTKTKFSEWVRLHKEETHLTAAECLELGIIDEVIQ